jgi:hypothetical protein
MEQKKEDGGGGVAVTIADAMCDVAAAADNLNFLTTVIGEFLRTQPGITTGAADDPLSVTSFALRGPMASVFSSAYSDTKDLRLVIADLLVARVEESFGQPTPRGVVLEKALPKSLLLLVGDRIPVTPFIMTKRRELADLLLAAEKDHASYARTINARNRLVNSLHRALHTQVETYFQHVVLPIPTGTAVGK